MICLNKNNPDIKNILDSTGVHILTLTIAYNKWIKANPSEDRMPTVEELGLSKQSSSLKESKLNDVMTYLLDVFDISLSGNNYIYNNNIYSKESIVKKLLSLEFFDNGTFIFNADGFVNNNPSIVSYVNTRLNVPVSIESLKQNLNVYVSQSTDPVYALSNLTEFIDSINNKKKLTETIDSSYIEFEERFNGLRNKDKSRKRYTSETKATNIARDYNKNNPDGDLRATVIKVMGEIGDTRVYYAVQLVEKDVLPSAISKIEIEKVAELIKSDESIMKQLGITYTNEDGNLCAANGLSNAVSGTQWKIVKDFKGKPKHRQGGYNITIKDNGFYVNDIKAKNGLLLINKNI